MKLWLRITVSVGLLALLFLLLPWGEVREALLRLAPRVWVGVLAGFVAGHALGIFKWRLFVNAGRASLRVRDAVHCYSAGLFANLCLPSIVGGDVLRAAMAAKFTRRPEAAFLGGVIDRLTDMIAMVILDRHRRPERPLRPRRLGPAGPHGRADPRSGGSRAAAAAGTPAPA